MKKFDIELAKQGKPVCTMDGRPVRILCYDKRGAYPIVAIISDGGDDLVYGYTESGSCAKKDEGDNLDLMIAGEKRKVWVNVYKGGADGSKRIFGGLNATTEETAKENIIDSKNYIATVPVEWEE